MELPFGYSAVLSLVCSPDFAQDGTIYAATEEHGLWASFDRGASWRQLSAFDDPLNALLVSGNEILAVTGSRLLHSTDQGHSWQTRWATAEEAPEITAVLAPQGFSLPSKALVGFMSGEIEILSWTGSELT